MSYMKIVTHKMTRNNTVNKLFGEANAHRVAVRLFCSCKVNWKELNCWKYWRHVP